jgi:1,4-alpha-glucan branching enzyme
MNTFHVWTEWPQPQLSLWRDPAAGDNSRLQYDALYRGAGPHGLLRYEALLDDQLHPPAHAKVYRGGEWEENTKTLPRTDQYRFHSEYWFAHGSARVLTSDPFAVARPQVIIHLITAQRFKEGNLYLWTPGAGARVITNGVPEPTGRRFVVELSGIEQHLFLFKFFNPGSAGRQEEWEPEYANKLWSSTDGAEIWVHSRANTISTTAPVVRRLRIRYLQREQPSQPFLHLWQEDSDFEEDVAGVAVGEGWIAYDVSLYTERGYKFCFFTRGTPDLWEDAEANRQVFLRGAGEAWTTSGDGRERLVGNNGVWTLEGDHELFGAAPLADRMVSLEVVAHAPGSGLAGPLLLDVWVNRARGLLHRGLQPDATGRWTFLTYGGVVTSFVFRAGIQKEGIPRHFLKVGAGSPPSHRFVVLGRASPVPVRPVANLFLDPAAAQFEIARPGVWTHGDSVRFAVHCPTATTVEIVGEWTGWEAAPVPMRSTPDAAYWWAEIPRADILTQGRTSIYGVLYKFRINQVLVTQDPAADWVESSNPQSASKFVDHDAFVWTSNAWQRPGWEYLSIYQLHPSRFSTRGGLTGLPAVTRELTAGYLREINATAILLMPTCEFAGDQGWGYNPSFFYSVESSYGGPTALKALVDACHQRGIAVMLDVVFNHAGASDNVLWEVARDSFFDGDTEWGAMINFDHPQVIHFFEQNLVHFMKTYRIDGFRFDFTRVIRYGNEQKDHVKKAGSGGGWEFMQKLRAAVHRVDARCLLTAENYPNEWDLTWDYGPMDSQWHDEFHDRLVEAAKGFDVMGSLARALQITHGSAGRWHAVTNFPESHDEVGNVNDRIVNVAGPGQGFRRNKVAAAIAIFSRGIPLWFMGCESGEWRQFDKDKPDPLPLDDYEASDSAERLRAWWRKLVEIRRGNARIEGPAPLTIHFAQERMLAFSRGNGSEFFVVLNFGNWSGQRSLAELNLPWGEYKELLNSTWGDYRIGVENEDEHPNGGWDARLRREYTLNIPDYGVVILERR